MIGAAIRELCGGDVQNSFPRALRDQVDEAKQILTGVSKSHPPSNSGLVIRGASGHIKGDHALILIPDIDHPVHFGMRAGDAEAGEKVFPVFFQLRKGLHDRCAVVVLADHGVGSLFVDHAVGFPLVLHRVLHINELENKACRLTGRQCNRKFEYGAG